jgi:hypothetical protein
MLTATILVVAATTFFALFVRAKDIPPPDPVSPTQHLDERKAAIYENLRDLQFEYRVGKLSDADYQSTKIALQKELAVVLAEIDKFAHATPVKAKHVESQAAKVVAAKPVALSCPSCGAKFAHAMKFCGECGKAMA